MRAGVIVRPLVRFAAFLTVIGVLVGCSQGPRFSSEHLDTWGESGSAPGQLRQPMGIAISPNGIVFVADAGNHRVQVFEPDGTFLRGLGERGDDPGQFRRPVDLDLDSKGRLYVAEYGGDRVQIFTFEGEFLRIVHGEDTAAGSFDAAAGIVVSRSGELFVADFYNDRVVVFRDDGTFDRVIGTSGRILSGRLHYPTDVDLIDGGTDLTVDEHLVVADAYNNRIQLFEPDGQPVTHWGGLFGLGLAGDRPGSFRVATGVAVDVLNRIYVADFENHRIQIFGRDGALLSIFGSRGNGPGELEHPTDLDIAPDGRIFVVDFGNDRIQIFEPLPDTLR